MRALLVLLIGVVTGCSFIGARVPDHPPAPEHCPSGVVIADVAGTAFFMLPPIAMLVDGATGGWERDPGALPFVMFGIPSAIVGTVYLASTIYGVRAHTRCRRMQEVEAQVAGDTRQPGARERERAPVVGDAAMVCAISEPDVGLCFVDETACAAEADRGGGRCEPRQAAWCFDVTSIAGVAAESTCAASRLDCDARRMGYTRDASLVVTTCGSYQQRVASPATTD